MREILLAPEARQDLEEITDFISLDDPNAAQGVLAEFMAAFTRLAEMPELGRRREELAPGRQLRFWPLHSYLVAYRTTPGKLEIVRVLSAWRDLPGILERE